MVQIEMSPPHSYSTSIYTIGLPCLHRLATIRNAADRQMTDRAIGIGRLCCSPSVKKSVHCNVMQRNVIKTYYAHKNRLSESEALDNDAKTVRTLDMKFDPLIEGGTPLFLRGNDVSSCIRSLKIEVEVGGKVVNCAKNGKKTRSSPQW